MPRDAARLLTIGDCLDDRHVRDLPALLGPRDVLVFNDTKVIPARLWGRRGQARIEATLIEELGGGSWRALARPARRLRFGDTVVFDAGLQASVEGKADDGSVVLRFELPRGELLAVLEEKGGMPLPPYIQRDAPDDRDRDDYQTVFAERQGAVAAPTAGLHFTPDLLNALEERGVHRVAVTLHVGAGTFLPVKTDIVAEHRMHAEWGEISAAAAAAINAARSAGGRVIAIGTTSLRLLESAATDGGSVLPFAGQTDLFITPGFVFRIADRLLTNFHLPRSTLFMLVCAFAGTARMRAAYAHAVAAGYRFYSYGDCCLIDRNAG